ncbi:MAG: aminopeptidase P family N-terminal domain-containing protein, partial [Geminicoccaceae bacterium]
MPDNPRTDITARIQALRAEMARRRLDAFIIPRFDAHQGEYVAPHDERLRYITGFSGSAGMTVVTEETVAVFVDGRYTVQLENECNGALFTHHHLFDDPPERWLRKAANEGWRVGFDPMHLPPAWFDRFDAALSSAAGELVAEADNPVDAVWPDQPPPPMGRVTSFPQQFAGRSAAEKGADLVAHMDETDADFYVDTQPDNIAWFLNLRGYDVAFNPMPHSFLLAERHGGVTWF